jgi:hypothetical protein
MRSPPFNPAQFRPDSGVASGLIGRFLFEGGGVLDSSGKQNTALLSQVAGHTLAFGNSPVGPSIILPSYTSATGSGVILPTAMNISTFTYSVLVNPSALGNQSTVIGGYTAHNGPQLDVNGGNVRLLKENVAVIGATSNTPVKIGVWQHIAASYDGTNYAVYFNGKVVASGTSSQSFSFTNQIIGAAFTGTFNFAGSIADVQIYNRVVTPAEMLAIYEAALGSNSFSSTYSPLDTAAAGSSSVNATGSQTLAGVTQSASGTGLVKASGSQTLAGVTQSAAAALVIGGSASQMLGDVAQSGAAAVIVSASGAQSLDSVSQVATGSDGVVINASGAQTLDGVTQSAAAVVPISASGSSELDNVTQSGAATAPDGAQGTEPLDNVVQFATASVIGNAAGDVTLDGVSQSGAVTVILGAVGVQTLGDVVQTATVNDLNPHSRLVVIPGVWSRAVSTKGQRLDPSVSVNGAYSKIITTPGLFGDRKAS